MKIYTYIVIIFLIGFLFICSCGGLKKHHRESLYKDYSTYYSVISKADSLFYIKQYEKSKNILDVLFKDLEPLDTHRFRECFTYIISKHHSGEKIEEKEFFNLIQKYGYTKDQIKKDTVLKKYYSQFVKEKEYDSLRRIYIASIDMDLRRKLDTMIKADQHYRTSYFEDDVLDKRKEVGMKNDKKLKEWFDKGIYPSKKLIGGFFFDDKDADVGLLLLHTEDKERFEYFLPKIKEFIKQGKTDPYIYGMLIDQYLLYNDREQLYGTYNIDQLDNKKYRFYNKNRRALKIGFPSIEFDVWKDSIFFSTH